MRVKKMSAAAMTVAAAAAGAVTMFAPAAAAYGPSYCNRSSCDFASQPHNAYIYFQMPQGTSESMVCWTDTDWNSGTNRWFKVSTRYGIGYTSANQVSNQTQVGHC